MNVYKVALNRSYLVSVKAENEEKAKQFAEYYIGASKDLSSENEREKRNFAIEEIELVYNEANGIDGMNNEETKIN